VVVLVPVIVEVAVVVMMLSAINKLQKLTPVIN